MSELTGPMQISHILLIDDHAMFRNGLRLLLCSENPNGQVHEAESIEQALALDIAGPDLVLLDIKLPGISGLDGIGLLKQRWPDAVLVVLSALDAPESLDYGALGFISKREDASSLLQMINQAMAHRGTQPQGNATQLVPLTPRQREVLELLSLGQSNKLIARRLSLAENTVRRHVQDILEYFQAASRSEAVAAARRRGLAD